MKTPSQIKVIASMVLATTLLLSSACSLADLNDDQLSGNSGQSFIISNQFIIIWNGYHSATITYVVIRNWPTSSTPAERLNDKRFVISGGEIPQIRLQDGSYEPVNETPHAYFFDGDNLTSFPIAMRESDFANLKPGAMASYNDLLQFFKTYETK